MDPRRITCAVCRRPVERTVWWDDPCNDRRVLRVHCHGATEEMRLDMLRVSMDTLKALESAQGVAFAAPTLNPPTQGLPCSND